MSHLTEEQLEELLADHAPIPDHLGRCDACRARLEEKRRLARRLREAFSRIQASPDLADRIRASLEPSEAGAPARRGHPVIVRLHRRLWSGLTAAAAVLALGVLATLYVNTTPDVQAARTELVAIHQQNLQSLNDVFIHEDPDQLAAYVNSRTGHAPAMACPKCGSPTCDCCVRQFRGRSAGSYLIRTEAGLVSVIVVADAPESLGLVPVEKTKESEPVLWQGACAGCRIASVRSGDRAYYAIGQAPLAQLEDLLHRLLD